MSLISDPMKLHCDVLENILDYLNVNDLLEASIVCKNWYDIIGASDTFKRKACVAIHRWNRSKNVNLLTDSTRDYQKYSVSDQEIGFEMLFLGTKNWKKVVINLTFSWLSYFYRYLAYFTPTVRELKLINSIIVTDDCDDKIVLKLPCLEELFLIDVSVLVLNSFMGTHEKLKSLHLQNIRNHKEVAAEGDAIRSFLELNNSLKDLVMHADVTNNLFYDDIAHSFNFELKNLTLCLDEDKAPVDGQLHITKFLQSQGSSLETLKLVFNQRTVRQNHQMFWGRQQNRITEVLEWKDFSIISLAWNQLTALKKLALRFTKNCKDKEEVGTEKIMTPNLSINEIVIHSAGCRNVPWRLLKYVLQACPNVEKVFISHLTKDVLQFIAVKLLKLQTLDCELMENGTGVFFDELKVLQTGVNTTMVIKGREETSEEEQQDRNNWENDDVVVGFPILNLEVDDSGSDFDDSDIDDSDIHDESDEEIDGDMIVVGGDPQDYGMYQWEP
ncbi:unnamed protein product [Diamesa hyperborea]